MVKQKNIAIKQVLGSCMKSCRAVRFSWVRGGFVKMVRKREMRSKNIEGDAIFCGLVVEDAAVLRSEHPCAYWLAEHRGPVTSCWSQFIAVRCRAQAPPIHTPKYTLPRPKEIGLAQSPCSRLLGPNMIGQSCFLQQADSRLHFRTSHDDSRGGGSGVNGCVVSKITSDCFRGTQNMIYHYGHCFRVT